MTKALAIIASILIITCIIFGYVLTYQTGYNNGASDTLDQLNDKVQHIIDIYTLQSI